MPNSSGSDFINQYGMVENIQFRAHQTKTQAAPAFSFVSFAFSFLWSPPPVPLEPIPEPLDVKAARVVSGAEQLVGDVERGHDGDALCARHPSCAFDLGHLPVEIGHRREKRIALLIRARDLVGPAHDVDIKGLGFLIHPGRYSGICLSRVSSRLRAPSIFSASCFLSPCNAANCWRSPRFSSRSRWHSRAAWRIFSSSVVNSVSIGTL